MNLFDFSLIEKGGPLMWPLLFLSFLGVILFFERTLYLHKGQIRTGDFISGIKNLLIKRRLIEALTLCEETPGPVASVTKAALLEYDQEEWRMRSAIQAAALVQIPLLVQRVGSIAAIARISPLIGLLGTVVGLLETFFKFEETGPYANVGILAGGFGEALITTATGLAIAIIAYVAHHFLHGRVRALVHDMEWVGNDMMQFLLRELSGEEIGSEDERESPETKTADAQL